MKKFIVFCSIAISALLFVAGASYASPITNGLIAEYEFSGNAGDATVYGASLTTDRFGNVNSAYDFDGNDYMQTTVNSNINPLSFSVWFRAETVGGEHSIVDSDVAGNYGHSLILGYWNGDSTLDVQYHNGYHDSAVTISPNGWCHAVVNYYSDKVELYINNTFYSFDNGNYVGAFDGSNFRFGRHNGNDPQWFDGQIDDIYFFNRALSANEVGVLYDYNPGQGDPVPEPATLLLFGLGMLSLAGISRKTVTD